MEESYDTKSISVGKEWSVNMRKKERLWRHAIALLAAVCMLNTMPCTSITVNANENIINIGTEEKEIPEQAEDNDTRQTDTAEDTGQTEKTEEADVGQTDEPEGPEIDDAGQTEDTEETEEPEETDRPEDAAGEKEDPADSDKEDSCTEEAEETEIEDLELEGAERSEETETKQAEAEGAMLLLSEEQEDVESAGEEDASYTDENGVVYHYHGHEDGTADLYEITEYSGKDINIPAYIDGYAVTQLTFHIWGMIPAVTIPETVTYIGAIAFVDSNIGTLYYNATEEVKVEPMPDAPFRHVKIGDLITGENVHILPADMFAFAEFQEDITITVETVGEEAFKYAAFPSLNLTGQVKEIRERAFIGAKIQTLRYDTEAVHTAGTTTEGMFWGASIQELAIGENITQLPDYVFCRADLCFDE